MRDPDLGGLAVGPLDHTAIAVADLDAALERYRSVLGLEPGLREVVEGQGVEVAFLEGAGEARLELIAPVSPESPVARFLERRGEGLHHVCFRVDDLEAALRDAEAVGIRRVDARPRRGAGGARIAFLHPAALGGVLVELKQAASSR